LATTGKAARPCHAGARHEHGIGFPTDFLRRPFVRDFLHGGLFDRIKQ